MDTNTESRAYEQAESQMESIIDMVAALECDYDRLEELKGEKETLEQELKDKDAEWDAARADMGDYHELDEEGQAELDKALEEAKDEYEDAVRTLECWVRDYQEELDALIEAAGDCENRDQAYERIQEDPLSVEVRSGWHSPGENGEPEEFAILLCTGGPAVRIRGELGQFNEPDRAWLEYQDWFTAWEEYRGDKFDHDALLTYCRQFYFGE